MAFVFDTFTDTNGTLLQSHTGEIGATWTLQSSYAGSSSQIQSNRVVANSGTAIYYASGTPSSADYDVEADYVFAVTNAHVNGIFGRYNSSTDRGYLVYCQLGGPWRIFNWNVGFVGSGYLSPPSDGQTVHVKFEMRGSTLKVYLDGVERISEIDSGVSAAGVAALVTDNGDVSLDNFTASNPPSPYLLVAN